MRGHHPVLFVAMLFGFVQMYGLVELAVADMRTAQSLEDISRAELASAQTALALLEERRAQRPATITLVGDIMLDRGVEESVEALGGEYARLFDGVRAHLQYADVTFGNLEGSISDTGSDRHKLYSFRFATSTLSALTGAGFDVLSVANNHALDWGREALCDSTSRLKQGGITPIGGGCTLGDAREPYVITVASTTVGFLAYTDFDTWGVATADEPGLNPWGLAQITNDVAHLKRDKHVDVVLVSLHWGDEYETRSHTKQQELGKLLIEAGVDVVVGHHPHVSQEIERYKSGWIVYSLGNFVFDQAFSTETMEGLLVDVHVHNGAVTDVIPHTITLDTQFRPSMQIGI